jgi:hypothetical protein
VKQKQTTLPDWCSAACASHFLFFHVFSCICQALLYNWLMHSFDTLGDKFTAKTRLTLSGTSHQLASVQQPFRAGHLHTETLFIPVQTATSAEQGYVRHNDSCHQNVDGFFARSLSVSLHSLSHRQLDR